MDNLKKFRKMRKSFLIPEPALLEFSKKYTSVHTCECCQTCLINFDELLDKGLIPANDLEKFIEKFDPSKDSLIQLAGTGYKYPHGIEFLYEGASRTIKSFGINSLQKHFYPIEKPSAFLDDIGKALFSTYSKVYIWQVYDYLVENNLIDRCLNFPELLAIQNKGTEFFRWNFFGQRIIAWKSSAIKEFITDNPEFYCFNGDEDDMNKLKVIPNLLVNSGKVILDWEGCAFDKLYSCSIPILMHP